MQKNHLIILTLAAMMLLLGFNIFNGNRHEQNRAALVDASEPASATTSSKDSNDIAAQPLGEQPKATTQIEQAQQSEADNLQQLDEAQ